MGTAVGVGQRSKDANYDARRRNPPTAQPERVDRAVQGPRVRWLVRPMRRDGRDARLAHVQRGVRALPGPTRDNDRGLRWVAGVRDPVLGPPLERLTLQGHRVVRRLGALARSAT